MAASDPIGYITLADPTFRNPVTNAAGWNNGPQGVFPGYSDTDPLPTRIATMRSGLLNYFTNVAIPYALGLPVPCRGLSVHDGYNGQQYNPYDGDPGYFREELPRETVEEAVDLLHANNLRAMTIVRPTENERTGAGPQFYGPDPVATVRRKIADWKSVGGDDIYGDSFAKAPATYFTVGEVQGWLDEFPGTELLTEVWSPNYADLPGVRALHQPAGYVQQDGSMAERPEWDYRSRYWLSTTADDPTDPADIARLSAVYAIGATIYPYVGGGFGNPAWSSLHRALWRNAYVGPGGAGSGASMSTINSSSTLAQVQAAYDDNASYAEDNSVAKCRAFLTACRILLRRMPAQTGTREAQLQLSPALIQKEMTEARSWQDANDTGPSSRRGPSTSVASFREFRDC